jgi:hypothetical protein
LDDKLKKGEVRETDILDDFQELDYLESRRDELPGRGVGEAMPPVRHYY